MRTSIYLWSVRTRKTVPMKKVATSQFHDYYEAQIKMHLICLRYFFRIYGHAGRKGILWKL